MLPAFYFVQIRFKFKFDSKTRKYKGFFKPKSLLGHIPQPAQFFFSSFLFPAAQAAHDFSSVSRMQHRLSRLMQPSSPRPSQSPSSSQHRIESELIASPLQHAWLAGPISARMCSCWTRTPASAAPGVQPSDGLIFLMAGDDLGENLFPVQPS
jgi:hypothetical protein